MFRYEALGRSGRRSPVSVTKRRHPSALPVVKPEHGALAALDAKFVVFAVGITPGPEQVEAVDHGLAAVFGALGPWTLPASYPNFVDRPGDDRPAFTDDAQRRLRDAVAAYDPAGIFRSNRPIEQTAQSNA